MGGVREQVDPRDTLQLVAGVGQRPRVARQRGDVARDVDDAGAGARGTRPASAAFDSPVRGGSTMNGDVRRRPSSWTRTIRSPRSGFHPHAIAERLGVACRSAPLHRIAFDERDRSAPAAASDKPNSPTPAYRSTTGPAARATHMPDEPLEKKAVALEERAHVAAQSQRRSAARPPTRTSHRPEAVGHHVRRRLVDGRGRCADNPPASGLERRERAVASACSSRWRRARSPAMFSAISTPATPSLARQAVAARHGDPLRGRRQQLPGAAGSHSSVRALPEEPDAAVARVQPRPHPIPTLGRANHVRAARQRHSPDPPEASGMISAFSCELPRVGDVREHVAAAPPVVPASRRSGDAREHLDRLGIQHALAWRARRARGPARREWRPTRAPPARRDAPACVRQRPVSRRRASRARLGRTSASSTCYDHSKRCLHAPRGQPVDARSATARRPGGMRAGTAQAPLPPPR